MGSCLVSQTLFSLQRLVLVEALWTGQTNTSPEKMVAAGGTNSCLLPKEKESSGINLLPSEIDWSP